LAAGGVRQSERRGPPVLEKPRCVDLPDAAAGKAVAAGAAGRAAAEEGPEPPAAIERQLRLLAIPDRALRQDRVDIGRRGAHRPLALAPDAETDAAAGIQARADVADQEAGVLAPVR